MSKKMLKRSLALGALLAFIITGSAMAQVTVDNQDWVVYHQLQGTTDSLDASNIVHGTNDRIVGGWSGGYTSKVESDHSTSVTVNGGNWRYIIGGSYLSGVENPQNINMKLVSSKVVVNKGATSPHIVGGTSGNDINNLVVNNENRTAHLVINSDDNYTFGVDSWWSSNNCLENLIVGGDHIKGNAIGENCLDNECDISLASARTEINGGTFDTLIIGGSLANQYNAKIGSGTLKTYVGKAETIITGGTFNKPIIAGGVAKGGEAISNVGEAILSISNATVNADVFTAGMVCYSDTSGEEGASVEKSTVTIKDSVVGNVYNTRGYFKYDNGWKFWAEDEAPNLNGSAEGYLDSSETKLTLINATANKVDITNGSVELRVEGEGETSVREFVSSDATTISISVDGATNDAIKGDTSKIAQYITIENAEDIDLAAKVSKVTLEEGKVTGEIVLTQDGEGNWTKDEAINSKSDAVSDAGMALKGHWRAHMNDMNKRMGELRMANGEAGVWTRMVRGESEYQGAKMQYNQYQLGYDEKLSVDKRWTVGAAVTFSEGDASYGTGSTEDKSTAFAVYGSKLNNDGTFVDLIARYARIESDLDDRNYGTGDYDANGYSVSAEFGKRIQQGNGLWIEPQVELTYGSVDGASVSFSNGYKANYDSMDSFIARAGFALGKDIKQGNVYARASYLYDFDGETQTQFEGGKAISEDFGGGWWEVGVGANINLSKATYIYADVEKTFGGEVDTNWQWNLGVRYSF